MTDYRIKEKQNYIGATFHTLQANDNDGNGWYTLHTITPKNLDKYISYGGTFNDSDKIIQYKKTYSL